MYQVQPSTETTRANREEARSREDLVDKDFAETVWVEASLQRGTAELSPKGFKHGVGRWLRWGTGQGSDMGTPL